MLGDRRMTVRGAVELMAVIAAVAACGDRGGDAARDRSTAGRVEACPGDAVPSVTSGGVGVVRLGSRTSELRDQCETRDTTFTLGEGTRERGTVVRFGSHALVAMAGGADSTISRIIVRDSVFRTERGVGIGSTVRELRNQYGQMCAALGEGRIVVSVAALPGISFETSLRPAALPRGGLGVAADPGTVPDTTRVTSLWVYEGTSGCGGS